MSREGWNVFSRLPPANTGVAYMQTHFLTKKHEALFLPFKAATVTSRAWSYIRLYLHAATNRAPQL